MKETQKLIPKRRFREFMDDGAWEQRKLGELANFSKGSGYTKSDLRDAGSPIILYGRLYTDHEILVEDVNTFVDKKENSIISLGGEVVVPSSGESAEDIARASAVGKPGIILGGDLNVIKPAEQIDPVFLALAISNGTPNRDMAKRAQGKSVVHLHNSDLKEINLVFLTSKNKEVSNLHLQIDNLITLQQRKLEKIQNLKSAYLSKMFPREGRNIPIKVRGFTDAWEQRELRDYKFIDTGRSKFVSNSDGEYEILGSTSVIGYDDNYDYEGDLLTARVGANAGELYRHSGKVKISDNTVFIQGRNLNFIFYMLMNFDIKKLSFGTGQPLIKASELIELELMLPKANEEQEKIGTFFNRLDNLITLHQRKLEKLNGIKQAYLNEMFV